MYNDFLKKINANLSQYINYESVVENADFSIVDDSGKDITQDIRDVISDDKKVNGDLYKYLLSNSIATLQYLGKHPDKQEEILRAIPNFADPYLSDINFALYYIDKVLENDIAKNTNFITKLKDILTKKSVNLIPIYMYITGDIDKKLVDQFVLTYGSSPDIITSNLNLIRDFIIAIHHNGKLEELYKDINVKNLLDFFAVNMKRSPINMPDNKTEENENTAVSKNIFDLNFTEIGNKSFLDFFNNLNILGDELLTENSIEPNEFDPKELANKYFSNLENSGKIENLKDILEEYTNYRQLNLPNQFKQFISSLFKKIKTASLRGKKMFRLSKAYTRYYIKNVLAYKVKANSDPEVLPQVIKVSTDEIQDLMYGDSIKHPENLSEIQNPAAKEQIFNDVEDAVEKISKGDLLEDGAADGMSIEDLAKKWAPMYNMQYEQMLDTLKTQEQAGSIVEQEHTDNLEIAKEIARDHLAEAPDYYTHLEDMETLFPDENVAVKPLPEPENMDLKPVSPQPEDSDHVCDGSCGGNCKCHDKAQTVEDKIQDLSGDGIMVVMVSDSPEVVEEQPLDFIQQIAAKIKR